MAIVFELCSDADLLRQYYFIRECCFRADLGIPDFDGSEDEQDRNSLIVTARVGDRCVGGARITCLASAPQHDAAVAGLLPKLGLEEERYCQWSRLAIVPEYRSMETLQSLCTVLIAVSTHYNFHYSILVSALSNARLYKRVHSSIGCDYKIYRDLEVPAEGSFNGLEHYLSVGFIHKAVQQQKGHTATSPGMFGGMRNLFIPPRVPLLA